MTGKKQRLRKQKRAASSEDGSANKEVGGPSNPTSSSSKGADALKVNCDDNSGPVLETKHDVVQSLSEKLKVFTSLWPFMVDLPYNDDGLPEYDIFIIHSKAQRDFTKRLCEKLRRWGYSPFWELRDDSLPTGKRFPELIFSAARQCRVAILILSQEFFTNSKWPMLMLAAFVDAHKESRGKNLAEVCILPVYLWLSRKDCTKNVQKRSEWVSTWQRWQQLAAEKGDWPIDVDEWEVALRVLVPEKGIEYKQSSGEAGFIMEIREVVRDLLPPPNISYIIDMKECIFWTIMEKISKTKASSNGARVVGVHGMTEIGTATFCKEICHWYQKKCPGYVIHVPLGSTGKIALTTNVATTLTDVNFGSLSLVDEPKVTEPRQIPNMAEGRMFKVLENVLPESIVDALKFVRPSELYSRDSIVLVTAPSIDILKSLQIDESDCFDMKENGIFSIRWDLLTRDDIWEDFNSDFKLEDDCAAEQKSARSKQSFLWDYRRVRSVSPVRR